MEQKLLLFEAIGQIGDETILEADRVLSLSRHLSRRVNRRTWIRTLLIAAVIAGLLGVTAYAARSFGLADRVFSLSQKEKVILVPNGLAGSPTYEGTGVWFSWLEEHRGDPSDPSLSFTQGDEALRSTCELYRAYSPEAARKLREIAEQYGLELYTRSLSITDRDRLEELTGLSTVLREGREAFSQGYVFADGSFHLEGSLEFSDLTLTCSLNRFSTGSLYPYGGAVSRREAREWELLSDTGETLDLILWGERRGEIWYLSEDGQIFVTLQCYDLPGQRDLSRLGFDEPEALLEALANRVDFAAICRSSADVRELAERSLGAEEHPEALERLEAFYQSTAFTAAREFEDFFTARFYGASFTGVWGQEGYEDISRELEDLARRYGLRYASSKAETDGIQRYDNGASYRELDLDGVKAAVHVIPRDALYTRLIHYVDFAEYSRIWICETESGSSIICASGGPEKRSGNYLFCETNEAWILVNLSTSDPALMEQAAQAIDWTRLN